MSDTSERSKPSSSDNDSIDYINNSYTHKRTKHKPTTKKQLKLHQPPKKRKRKIESNTDDERSSVSSHGSKRVKRRDEPEADEQQEIEEEHIHNEEEKEEEDYEQQQQRMIEEDSPDVGYGRAMEQRKIEEDASRWVNPEIQAKVEEREWIPLKIVGRTLDGWVDKYEITNKDECPGCKFGMTQQIYSVSSASNCNAWAELLLEIKHHRSSVNWHSTIDKVQTLYHEKIKDHLFQKIKITRFDYCTGRDETFEVDERISDASDWAGQKIYEHMRGYHVINKARCLARVIEMQEMLLEHMANSVIETDSDKKRPDKINISMITGFNRTVREFRANLKDLEVAPDALMSAD